MPPFIPEKTLYDLEWDRILDALAAHAVTTGGRARCLSLPILEDLEAATAELGRVSEWRSLLIKGEAPSLGGVRSDAAQLAEKARKQAVLELAELGEVADCLAAANRVAASMKRRSEDCPGLCEITVNLVVSTHALDAIEYAIDREIGRAHV